MVGVSVKIGHWAGFHYSNDTGKCGLCSVHRRCADQRGPEPWVDGLRQRPSFSCLEYDETAGARPICRKIRAAILNADPEIVETWKWGPHYGKMGMVCGYGAFQKHVSVAFFKGGLMKDPAHLFIEDDAPAKSMRRMKFSHPREVDERIITAYVCEAISLNVSGAKSPAPSIETPPDLLKLLKNNKALVKFFNSLAYTHRKEYIRWIEGAKKIETRQSRLKKAIVMLKQKIKHP